MAQLTSPEFLRSNVKNENGRTGEKNQKFMIVYNRCSKKSNVVNLG